MFSKNTQFQAKRYTGISPAVKPQSQDGCDQTNRHSTGDVANETSPRLPSRI